MASRTGMTLVTVNCHSSRTEERSGSEQKNPAVDRVLCRVV